MPQLLVLDGREDDVRFYDATTRKLVKRVKVGKGPTAIALAPNGRDAYVANTGSGDFSLLDVIRMQESGRFAAPPVQRPRSLVVTPDGTRLLVACEATKAVHAVETRTHRHLGATTAFDEAPAALATAGSGSIVYATFPQGSRVAALEPRTLQVQERIELPREPWGMDLSPDGRWLLVCCRGANQLAVVEAATGSLAASIPVGPSPVRVAAMRGGLALVATRGTNGVDLVSVAERKVVQTISCGLQPSDVVLGRGGRTAYVANASQRTVSVLDLEKRKVTDTLETGMLPECLAFRA